eukprot:618063-Hanusia_phi.AAC.1
MSPENLVLLQPLAPCHLPDYFVLYEGLKNGHEGRGDTLGKKFSLHFLQSSWVLGGMRVHSRK